MKTLLLDVDGVIADVATPVYKVAESICARPLPPPDQWQHHVFHLAMDLSSTEFELFDRAMRFDDDIGWKIDLYPGAEDFVKEVSKSYDVCFVTAQWKRMNHWVVSRENLLSEYFPDIDVIFTHQKFRVRGDILVDDQPDHVVSVQSRGVLFDRPWNRNFKAERRALDYEHLLSMLEVV